ncbi:MAG: glutamine synthetase [Bacteroidetes bacterium GWF2_42_66]|nr:MAG: glutamine synthetase [Bacteroidetes bacterium GWA2_42_15]OFX96031.1 MAG: glutamine synthetase [Bacteroidetes bacterium GWE2_42_39]OFY46606.1 MAG: glutamine synthetase [Bacteroidetes bacterium GWF2_42_66]HBL75569.1 glutamine synthetase [Prolixibacteraceae bacterium]HCR91061.1 glutamine synthetase [Prolixibacteraceae bacterium]
MEKDKILDLLKKENIQKIKFGFSDIDGVLRGKVVHKDKFLDAIDKNIGFCDVVFGWDTNDQCYDNSQITGWHTGFPDTRASIDLNTFRRVPWDNQIPFFLADFSQATPEGLAACPRTLLKKIRKSAEEMGLQAIFSMEFEWFNFVGTPNQIAESGYRNLQPITPGMFGYSIVRPSQYKDFFNALFDQLLQFDVPVEGIHTETGPGVYEATVIYDDVLNAADKAILFKTGVKEIALQHGLVASFMAKWNEQLPGCGGHIHQSLWNESGVNLFHSENMAGPMSELMKSYLAGILKCLPEVLPMYAPNINSYKRLREGAWAPTAVTWGRDNRTTAVRVIDGDAKSGRLEMRVPGADANPYLAMAACLASGLYGIKNNLKLDIEATTGNGYKNTGSVMLPSNLQEATARMKQSAIARELFGDGFVNHFTGTREWEWREYAKAVTDWELRRYFEII